VARDQPHAVWLDKMSQMAHAYRMSIFQLAQAPRPILVETIRAGVPAPEFLNLAKVLGLSRNVLASKLGLAPRTMTRKTSGKTVLSPVASEKVVRVARIVNKARLILADDASIATWLETPAPALGSTKPIDLLDTDIGAAEVEGLIVGLAHGNYQ